MASSYVRASGDAPADTGFTKIPCFALFPRRDRRGAYSVFAISITVLPGRWNYCKFIDQRRYVRQFVTLTKPEPSKTYICERNMSLSALVDGKAYAVVKMTDIAKAEIL